jgi:hypothetical protein
MTILDGILGDGQKRIAEASALLQDLVPAESIMLYRWLIRGRRDTVSENGMTSTVCLERLANLLSRVVQDGYIVVRIPLHMKNDCEIDIVPLSMEAFLLQHELLTKAWGGKMLISEFTMRISQNEGSSYVDVDLWSSYEVMHQAFLADMGAQ